MSEKKKSIEQPGEKKDYSNKYSLSSSLFFKSSYPGLLVHLAEPNGTFETLRSAHTVTDHERWTKRIQNLDL